MREPEKELEPARVERKRPAVVMLPAAEWIPLATLREPEKDEEPTSATVSLPEIEALLPNQARPSKAAEPSTSKPPLIKRS